MFNGIQYDDTVEYMNTHGADSGILRESESVRETSLLAGNRDSLPRRSGIPALPSIYHMPLNLRARVGLLGGTAGGGG